MNPIFWERFKWIANQKLFYCGGNSNGSLRSDIINSVLIYGPISIRTTPQIVQTVSYNIPTTLNSIIVIIWNNACVRQDAMSSTQLKKYLYLCNYFVKYE